MSVTEIKRQYCEVLERVHHGEEVVVTRWGVPWGRMLPPETDDVTDNLAHGLNAHSY